jgi:alkanesulfonate monooxygenase SsuD/methylene tetrahydromethanopterin reductase-like flavin-dependent oxidoreductase (luciferase family)
MTDLALVPADVVRTVPDGRVVWGMQLPIQSQSTLYTAEWETQSGPDELAAVARAADDAGCFYIGVCDHTAIPRRLADAMSTTWYDTTATLAWLAAVTTRTRLLSHVLILAQRHPLRAAKELSTIDLLSGGRVIVGVGAGHVTEEYELLAGDFAGRGRDTDEAVSALARCFTAEFPELPGPRWPARDLGLGPPIWIGGSSPAAIRRTAAFGDGWLPQGTRRRDLPGQIRTLRELRDELRGGAPIDIGTIAEPLYLTSGGSGADLPGYVLQGTADQVAESLLELVGMGVNHLQVRFVARSADEWCDQTAHFGAEVGPLLNR